MCIQLLLYLLILATNVLALQSPCYKEDFDNSFGIMNEMCQNFNGFKVETFENQTDFPIPEYSNGYFIISSGDGDSCIQNGENIDIAARTTVELNVFTINPQNREASVIVTILDGSGGTGGFGSEKIENSVQWTTISVVVFRAVSNAQIRIQTDNKGNGVLAIDYLIIREFGENNCVFNETTTESPLTTTTSSETTTISVITTTDSVPTTTSSAETTTVPVITTTVTIPTTTSIPETTTAPVITTTATVPTTTASSETTTTATVPTTTSSSETTTAEIVTTTATVPTTTSSSETTTAAIVTTTATVPTTTATNPTTTSPIETTTATVPTTTATVPTTTATVPTTASPSETTTAAVETTSVTVPTTTVTILTTTSSPQTTTAAIVTTTATVPTTTSSSETTTFLPTTDETPAPPEENEPDARLWKILGISFMSLSGVCLIYAVVITIIFIKSKISFKSDIIPYGMNSYQNF